jgi:hypothetical protein
VGADAARSRKIVRRKKSDAHALGCHIIRQSST